MSNVTKSSSMNHNPFKSLVTLSKGLLSAFVAVLCFGVAASICSAAPQKEPKLRALIIDGQNNHNWKGTTPVLKQIIEETGLFQVDVATTPPAGKPMNQFKPEFAKYDVVVMNYNGDDWAPATREAFVSYVKGGGGLVIQHAADNSFGTWAEYNEMIGLGGWGNRDEKSGPMLRWRNGKIVRDETPGKGGSHGKQIPFVVTIRNPKHPITQGLPENWMHASDELYSKLRGPAKNLDLLATAIGSVETGNSGENEPALFTIQYGKGRVFHTTLGHDVPQLKCVGFVVTFQRGVEWAATGKVTRTEVPKDFPTADKVSVRQ